MTDDAGTMRATELREGLNEPEAVSSPLIEAAGAPRRRRSAWNRFRRHRLAMAGLIFLVAVGLVAIFAPIVSLADPNAALAGKRRQPKAEQEALWRSREERQR